MSSLLVLVLSGSVIADDRSEFARETGLDIDLVGVIQVDVNGTELTVVFVFINDRTFDSRISAALRATLLPYVGRNAIYVNPNIKSVVSWFDFDPLEISVQASGGEIIPTERASWIEITPGFFQGRFDVNPAGASQGSGSEGVLLLGEAIDSDEPFDLIYGGKRTTFAISQTVPASVTPSSSRYPAVSESHEPIEVPLLGSVREIKWIVSLPSFSSGSVADLLQLDHDDVRAAEMAFPNGETLRLLFIRLDAQIRESALALDLVEILEPLIGTGAVMVWAYSPTGVGFDPSGLYFIQSGSVYPLLSDASFVDLTQGFADLERIDPDEVVAGVIRLPKKMDPNMEFVVAYIRTRVTFP